MAATELMFAMMRMPDFFIVGAPKCGTTALYSYLKAHPHVFMPHIKEPHYFSRDLPGRRDVREESAYAALFAEAPKKTLMGEASASYLFSEVAITDFMERNPAARSIVMLRNPIDLVQAFHAERVYNLNEDVADFDHAWNLQGERRSGRCIPGTCRELALLQYRQIASFAPQIRRLFDRVPKAQRMVCLFEEFRTRPRETYTLRCPDQDSRLRWFSSPLILRPAIARSQREQVEASRQDAAL